MKKLLILFLLFPLAVACQTEKNEAASAAEEYYLKYADRKDLTVALVSGYEKNGATLNVVKLQAHDDETFRQLLDEFGVRSKQDVGSKLIEEKVESKKFSDSKKANVLKVIVDGDTLDGQSTFSSLPELGSFFDTLIRTIASLDTEQCNRENDGEPQRQGQVGSLMKTASTYGNSGYGTLTDDANLTVWLLFYNSLGECTTLLENIISTK